MPLQAFQFFGEDFSSPGSSYLMVLQLDEEEEMEQGSIRLSDSEGNVRSLSHFFPYPVDERNLWVALLGLGPELDTGRYRIDVECQLQQGPLYYSKKLQLSDRDFPEQLVHLNEDLTTLRTEPDPRKAEDARLLWSTLAAFDIGEKIESPTFQIPIEEEIYVSTAYGARRTYQYSNGDEARTLHNGLDWAAPKGTPVYAVASGRVVLTRNMIVTGNTVVIEHLPGVYSVYYHLDSIDVETGTWIDEHSMVGKVGESGLATGPHLHWEIRISKIPVDPETLMGGSLIDKDRIISMIDSE